MGERISRTLMIVTIVVLSLLFLTPFFVFSMFVATSFEREKNAPFNQPNTTWTSEDGVITFNVYEESKVFYDISEAPVLTELAQKSPKQITSYMYGAIELDGEKYDFYMEVYGDNSAVFISTDISEVQHEGKSIFEVKDDYTLLSGSIDLKSERKFVVTVYNSQFYEEGAEIVFRRVDD